LPCPETGPATHGERQGPDADSAIA
jgi:hypothetical protein